MAERYVSALTGPEMDEALLDMAQHNSEAWAIGERHGVAVGSSDDTYQNNSKYYATEAEAAAARAEAAVPAGTEGAVLFSQAQSLTDAQKQTAFDNIAPDSVEESLDLINRLTYKFYNTGVTSLDGLKTLLQNYINAMPNYSSRFFMIRTTSTFQPFYGNGTLYYVFLIRGGAATTFPAIIIKQSGSSSTTYPRMMYMALSGGTTWFGPTTIVA
ncbi:MAG: hypothetical protein IJK59_11495 [Firmicutes bacterium]|nr:hypothetical protein [Bacillota bacterium]MBQ6261854.1 hypothetical protein [Bacillota bacterium]